MNTSTPARVVCRSSTPMRNLKINKYWFKGWVVCDGVCHFTQGLWQRYWDDWEAALSSHCECSHQDKVRRDGKWFPCYWACLASDSSMQYLLFLWFFPPLSSLPPLLSAPAAFPYSVSSTEDEDNLSFTEMVRRSAEKVQNLGGIFLCDLLDLQ